MLCLIVSTQNIQAPRVEFCSGGGGGGGRAANLALRHPPLSVELLSVGAVLDLASGMPRCVRLGDILQGVRLESQSQGLFPDHDAVHLGHDARRVEFVLEAVRVHDKFLPARRRVSPVAPMQRRMGTEWME